jgi:hypothetical protein
MCLFPRLHRNPKYKPNKKNNGIVPIPTDNRVMLVPIGCGHCKECRNQKKREWQTRLTEDIRKNKNAKFVTLTFSNEEITKLYSETKDVYGYEKDNQVATIAVERFRERWRKKHKKSVRHWLITELGTEQTEHLHLHGLIWTDQPNSEIEKHWKYGNIWVGTYVNERTVNYITKYLNKIDAKHKYYKPKMLTSAGIGGSYINRIDATQNKYQPNGKTKETYKTRTGYEIAIPTYLRNKIYTEEEREKLWLEKLDKKVRYINGKKIDISKDEKLYKQLLKQAQRENSQQGYTDGKINWQEKNYEQQRRVLKQLEKRPDHMKNEQAIVKQKSMEEIGRELEQQREAQAQSYRSAIAK